jgi:hypothetical protein
MLGRVETMFPAGEGYQGCVNLKGYRDFAPEIIHQTAAWSHSSIGFDGPLC